MGRNLVVALDVGADVEKIKAAKTGSRTIAEDISETIAKIGENMTLRRAASLSVAVFCTGVLTIAPLSIIFSARPRCSGG